MGEMRIKIPDRIQRERFLEEIIKVFTYPYLSVKD